MKYVFTRNRDVTSTRGHSLSFEAGVPQHVPTDLIREVVDAGGEPADDDAEEATAVAVNGKVERTEPTDATDRQDQIKEAIAQLVEEGDRASFTAGGSPHVTKLTELLGWKPDGAERDQAWIAFQADANEAKGA